MVGYLLNAISKAIYNSFGDGYRIYGDESVKQGTITPCFFISLKSCTQKCLLGNRFLRTYSFDIRYFPENVEDYSEMYQVASDLFEILEIINLENNEIIRGTKLNYCFDQGIMHFFADYSIVVQKEENKNKMEHLGVNLNKA